MMDRVRAVGSYLALSVVALGAMCSECFAQVTLPSTGVDVGEHVTAVITDLGAVALLAVGGFFAFLLIRMSLRWGRVAIR